MTDFYMVPFGRHGWQVARYAGGSKKDGCIKIEVWRRKAKRWTKPSLAAIGALTPISTGEADAMMTKGLKPSWWKNP